MDHAIDALIEIFTWVGFGAFLLLAIAVVIAWAADGTWLPADAIIDRDGEQPVARWFDADGDANSAPLSAADAAVIGDADAASIWYRHGWQGRMRLQRRPAGLRTLTWSAVGMLALGVVSLVAGWVLYFARG
ncbi:hypothetical protein HMPREF1529_01674 [Microbacterium sp. oral taxon 186 str. F0373]|uniref:hypothetical protein n=1 Tax=Microbacterium sp. oral taxon 186 TaxID=712383 RepID=UPI00034E947D|nr:hypothetical protein [Microbacterium sp. oral taxon 186]EPD85061.1 hypothetical protein HMPREF1529_01674 [Microbacterium sp. oral taxon 186 str. F0373]